MILHNDELPNFLMVNDKEELPSEIIEDYFTMIMHLKDDHDSVLELLEQFFDDVNIWSVRNLLIQQAKMSIYNLQLLDEEENVFIEEDEDD